WASRRGAELPLLILIMNNRYGISTPFAGQHAYDQIAERGKAFGIPTAVVDGNDAEAAYAALEVAIDYVRTERKPYLLEAMVSRLPGHSAASGANPALDEVDCLDRFERALEDRKLLTRNQMEQLRDTHTRELLEASREIRDEPHPAPGAIWDHVFADQNLVG